MLEADFSSTGRRIQRYTPAMVWTSFCGQVKSSLRLALHLPYLPSGGALSGGDPEYHYMILVVIPVSVRFAPTIQYPILDATTTPKVLWRITLGFRGYRNVVICRDV